MIRTLHTVSQLKILFETKSEGASTRIVFSLAVGYLVALTKMQEAKANWYGGNSANDPKRHMIVYYPL